MTTQEQIKALAELDGWTWHECLMSADSGDPYSAKFGYTGWLHSSVNWDALDWQQQQSLVDKEPEPPSYLTSYDTIIPLIQKQDKVTQCEFLAILFRFYVNNADHDLNYMTVWPMTFALTPSQLCEALLRATGKWKE